MASKIEQDIDAIEQYIAGCKTSAFNKSEIKVDREFIEELISDMRVHTPEEIAQYKKMLANQQNIIAAAQQKAEAIIAEAQSKSANLLSENQIMQQAYAKAEEIVRAASMNAEQILNEATMQANEIKAGAMDYTDGELKAIESILSAAIDSTQNRTATLVGDLTNILQVVSQNRAQLTPPEPIAQVPGADAIGYAQAPTE